jgi:transcriptional regulator with XRE-family HTH domain
MNLVQTMKIYINSRGISQLEFGRRVGMTQKRVNAILLMRSRLTPEEFLKLTEFFHAQT